MCGDETACVGVLMGVLALVWRNQTNSTSIMGQEILLVGSVPIKSVEDVMTTFGGALGRYLPAIPDGEVGERKSWVLRLSYQVFNGHIDLETIKRPPRSNGVEQLMPLRREDIWQFKVRDGVD